MDIFMKPGEQNEELIEEVRKKKAESSLAEWTDFLSDVARNEEWMDALYYDDEEQGKWALEDQTQHLNDSLFDDERYYFAGRFGNHNIVYGEPWEKSI